MIHKYIVELQKLRKNQSFISKYNYEEGIDKDGDKYDKNELARNRIIHALQYDRNSSDEDLIKKIFEQEIIKHDNSVYQGINDALNIVAFLLSEYRNPENIWLFYDAKTANFDTHCGFDYQYLFSAGIPETFQYLDNVKHKDKKGLQDYIGKTLQESTLSESELEEWRNRKNDWYPSQFQLETTSDEIDLAIELGEKDILINKISEWKQQQSSWNQENLQTLSYYESCIQNTSGQIWAYEQLTPYKTEVWSLCVHLQTLIKLYLKNNQIDQASDTFKLSLLVLEKIDANWKQLGLGRTFIELSFDIFILSGSNKNSQYAEVSKWGIGVTKEIIKNKYSTHWNLLEKGILVSKTMNEYHLSQQLEQILEQEKEEHQKLFGDKK